MFKNQDSGGIGWGDHFLPYKFIKRSFECWATSTKQLLNTGGGHQAPRKAAHSLWKVIGQNIKDKKERQNSRKPSHWQVCGEFWNLRGQHNQQGNTHTHTEYAPNCNSQQRSSPDAHVGHQWVGAGQGGTGCTLRVRTGPEWLEDNLRELTWDSNPNCGIARERRKRKKKKRTFQQNALT